MVNIKAEREFLISNNLQTIENRLVQWSIITEFKYKSKLDGKWLYNRGSGLKASFTGNLWDIPSTVEVRIIRNNPLTVYASYQVKSGAVIVFGDQENKMINLFLEHLIAYLKGAFDTISLQDSSRHKISDESSLTCSHCEKSFDTKFQFCPYCGLSLKITCLNCGENIESNFNLCPFCGVEIHKK